MRNIALAMGLSAAAAAVFADTHVWVGGNSSGGWNTPSNWTNEQGVAECPSAGDTVVFDHWDQTNVVNDADFDLFNSVSLANLSSWSDTHGVGQTLVLDFAEDRTVNCRISGAGRLIVKGASRVEFAPSESGSAKTGSYYSPYYISPGGIIVDDSATLVLAQTGFAGSNGFTYGPMTIGAEATVVAASNLNYTVFETLLGDGTLRRDSGTTALGSSWLQTGWSGANSATRADFGGKITGTANLINYGNQAFTGTESDFSGYFYTAVGYGTAYMDRGWSHVASIGEQGEPSSIGANTWLLLGYGGNLRYIGEGEESDRNFTFDGQFIKNLYPQYIDAGPNGGLELSGSFSVSAYGSTYNQRSVVFTGSNSSPCTISGPYNMNYTQNTTNYNFYTRKEGSGVWEFKENASSTYKGVFDVREGTLRFDSIAETNVVCALGMATRLTREFTGRYKKDYDSPYALRLGRTSLAGAADAVLEFNGSASCKSTTRPMLMTGEGHLRANGVDGAALAFGGVRAASGEKTLVIDGTNTADNTIMDVADGDGVLSLVKDGPGTWVLSGDHTFSGDLAVKGGTLKVPGSRPFRYFRVTFWDNVFNHPSGSYVKEFGMYAADGTRLNSGLALRQQAGTTINAAYTITAGAATNLLAGEIAMDHIPGVTANSFWWYGNNPPDKLCDKTSDYMQFMNTLYSKKYAVSMRLADDAKELAYVDFVQSSANYDPNRQHPNARQTASAFRVEGSLDGLSWTELVVTNSLCDYENGVPKERGSNKWFFSESGKDVDAAPEDRSDVGAGEGLALTTPARRIVEGDMLTNVRSVSVDYGATLEYDGEYDRPEISRLKVDATKGCGTITGFVFATDMTVDVTDIPAGAKSLELPANLSGVANFDDVATWTFLKDGVATTRYHFELSKTGLKINSDGCMIIVR